MTPIPYRSPRDKRETSLRTLSPGWTVPVPNAQLPAQVVSVEKTGANQATWTFNIQIFEVWDTITELQASANGVTFVAPTSTTNPTLFQFAATYPFPISAGCVFRIVTQMESMTFLYDNLLALPQKGVVISAQAVTAPMMLSVPADENTMASAVGRKTRRKALPGTRRAA